MNKINIYDRRYKTNKLYWTIISKVNDLGQGYDFSFLSALKIFLNYRSRPKSKHYQDAISRTFNVNPRMFRDLLKHDSKQYNEVLKAILENHNLFNIEQIDRDFLENNFTFLKSFLELKGTNLKNELVYISNEELEQLENIEQLKKVSNNE